MKAQQKDDYAYAFMGYGSFDEFGNETWDMDVGAGMRDGWMDLYMNEFTTMLRGEEKKRKRQINFLRSTK